MENDSAFVALEGVHSVIKEHRAATFNPHALNPNPPSAHPTKLPTVLIKYPAHNKASGSQALAQLLGGGKEKNAKKDKVKADDAARTRTTIPNLLQENARTASASPAVIPKTALEMDPRISPRAALRGPKYSGSRIPEHHPPPFTSKYYWKQKES